MRRFVLVALAAGSLTLSHAGSGPWFDSYTHQMEAGEWELEIGADAVRPREGAWRQGQQIELEHGFGPRFNGAVYLLTGRDGEGDWGFDGFMLRGRCRPWDAPSFWLPGFYLEYAELRREPVYRSGISGFAGEDLDEIRADRGRRERRTEREVEGRLIFARDFDWGTAAFNLLGERDVHGGPTSFGYAGGIVLKGRPLLLGAGPAYDPDGDGDAHLLYGVEVYGGLGDSSELGLDTARQEHFLQPLVAFPLSPRLSLKTAVALGLTRPSPDSLRAVLTIRLGSSVR